MIHDILGNKRKENQKDIFRKEKKIKFHNRGDEQKDWGKWKIWENYYNLYPLNIILLETIFGLKDPSNMKFITQYNLETMKTWNSIFYWGRFRAVFHIYWINGKLIVKY